MKAVICIANQKGGIGKTTTATNLSSILSSSGNKTLLIDADPQGNSTDTYRAISKDTATLYDVILDKDDPLPIAEAIQKTEIGDIIASDPELKQADIILNDNDTSLRKALSELKEYDYVVIDTAPANNKLLKSCLIAADKVVIPLTADRYSIQGLADLNKTLLTTKKEANPSLEVSGILLIKYKKRQLLAREVKEALDEISTKMNTKVFDTTIRESTYAQKAQATRTTLIKYAPNCTTAKDYKDFTIELLKGVI